MFVGFPGFWYFSTMPRHSPKSFPARNGTLTSVEFDLTKYGPEILIDCAWVSEMPSFVRPYPHVLNFYDILLITRGRGDHFLDGRRDSVRPGQVYFVSPGEVRNWQVRDLEGLCMFFPALFLDEFFSDPMFLHRLPYFRTRRGAPVLQLSQAQAHRLQREMLAVRDELRHLRRDSAHLMRAHLYGTLVRLARLYEKTHAPGHPGPPNRTAVRFRELMEREATRRHQVKFYARQLGVSPNYLNALCKTYLGLPAKRVMEEHLATVARRLLLYSEDSTAGVGYTLGFKDPAYFARFFRRMTGCTPSQLRRDRRSFFSGAQLVGISP